MSKIAEELVTLLDNNKEELTSQMYKSLIEKIGELHAEQSHELTTLEFFIPFTTIFYDNEQEVIKIENNIKHHSIRVKLKEHHCSLEWERRDICYLRHLMSDEEWFNHVYTLFTDGSIVPYECDIEFLDTNFYMRRVE